MGRSFLFKVLILLINLSCLVWGKDLYVASNGSDSNPGTKEKPFATMEGARDAVRQSKKGSSEGWEGTTVWFRGGIYRVSRTIDFNDCDGGKEGGKICYRAMANEDVIFEGGQDINTAGACSVSDANILKRIISPEARKNIKQIDLKAQEIIDYGELKRRGFAFHNSYSHGEISFDGRSLQLARWPNDDYAKIACAPKIKGEQTFTYDCNRPKLWTQAEEPWAIGFWGCGWADSQTRIGKIDIKHKTITLEGNKGEIVKEARWRAINLLEEIDTPGEWYINRNSGVLYLWPPAELKGKKLTISMLKEPMIKMDGAANLTIEGICFQNGRGGCIEIQNCKDVTIAGCKIKNMGERNIKIEGGANCGIVGCDIFDSGAGGIYMAGGDRENLIECGHYAINNHIWNFSRLNKTYRPAISAYGIGFVIKNNLIHDAPHSAIIYHGNNVIIEFNKIYNVCGQSNDAGAIYTGRDWSARGNVIRYNLVYDVKSPLTNSFKNGVHAVYLDDCASGNEVLGNIFYQIGGRAVMIGGGRDNIIENNVIAKCDSAIFTDRRGLVWINEKNPTWNLRAKLEKFDYKRPPWSTSYPELVKIFDNGYKRAKDPEGNIVKSNIGWKNRRWLEENSLGASGGFKFFTFENNVKNQDPLFRDEKSLNLSLCDNSAAYNIKGFKKIPYEKIGLYIDDLRLSLPKQD